MYSLSIFLRTKISVVTMVTAALLSFSSTVNALPSKSYKSISLHKVNPTKPASKYEIIAAVKKEYKHKGRILSVRKKYKAYGNDCHHVKFIDRHGELLLIHVACSK